jgi:hypothetical protein
MASRWPAVPGVIFRDYVPGLEEVYVSGAVLFAPGVLRGGLKTKVAEAFAYGCAVIGNSITFEGLELNDYPLLVGADADLAEIVKTPSVYLDKMRRAAEVGQEYVKVHFSRKRFVQNWTEALG